MEQICIYFNPEYSNFGQCFMIFIKDFGMWLLTEKDYIRILQKPTEPIIDVDVYASSREFYKIVSITDKSINYYNDFDDKDKLKSILIEFKNKSLWKMKVTPFFKCNFSEFYGILKRSINLLEKE